MEPQATSPAAIPAFELRRSSSRRGFLGEDRELEQLIRPADERRLRCRLCGSPVTSDGHRISIAGRHVHRRVNPAGIEFEFGCFDQAPGAVVSGQPTAEFSWFAGTTWAFSLCRQCGAHLGWFFDGRYADAGGHRFHGLVLNRLQEERPEPSFDG